jgi:urease accessory protein
MLIAHRRLPQGQGLAAVLLKRAPTLTLDWDLRQRSRFDAPDSGGRRIGVILPRGQVLRGGDALLTEDGEILRIVAAPQPVLQVRTCAEHGQPFDLMRAVYHLANRHVPLELQPTLLQLEPDPVLAGLLRQLGLIVSEALAPFEPEGGAYGAAGGAHGHGHDHAHGHDHVHGQACGHDHGHDHDHGHGHGH